MGDEQARLVLAAFAAGGLAGSWWRSQRGTRFSKEEENTAYESLFRLAGYGSYC